MLHKLSHNSVSFQQVKKTDWSTIYHCQKFGFLLFRQHSSLWKRNVTGFKLPWQLVHKLILCDPNKLVQSYKSLPFPSAHTFNVIPVEYILDNWVSLDEAPSFLPVYWSYLLCHLSVSLLLSDFLIGGQLLIIWGVGHQVWHDLMPYWREVFLHKNTCIARKNYMGARLLVLTKLLQLLVFSHSR